MGWILIPVDQEDQAHYRQEAHRACQRRLKIPQKRRLKIPHLRRLKYPQV